MASTVRSHRANQGSIPCIGVFFYLLKYFFLYRCQLISVKVVECALDLHHHNSSVYKILTTAYI